jgi:hypothetical protein
MKDDIGFQTMMRPDESAEATNLELEMRKKKKLTGTGSHRAAPAGFQRYNCMIMRHSGLALIGHQRGQEHKPSGCSSNDDGGIAHAHAGSVWDGEVGNAGVGGDRFGEFGD